MNNVNKKIQVSIITSEIPSVLSKTFSMVDGKLVKLVSAQLCEGSCEVKELSSITEFAELIGSLKKNQACCYGRPEIKTARILSKSWYQKRDRPNNTITRTKEYFGWPDSAGILMLDYDPDKDQEALTNDELMHKIYDIVPELKLSDHCLTNSSGSFIYSTETNEVLVGERGRRVYIPLINASDIPRAGEALAERLSLKGNIKIEVGIAGQLLQRGLLDTSVWQPNRLDFVAGAKCEAGLDQRRGKPTVYEYGISLDSEKFIPSLSDSEKVIYKQLVKAEKERVKPEAKKQRERYSTTLALNMIEESGNTILFETAQSSIKRMLDHSVLTGDMGVHLDDGRLIQVQDIIDEPTSFDGLLTKDPVEPDYDNSRTVGKIYGKGKLGIFSQAHGGMFYRIVRNPVRIQIKNGELSSAVDETLKHLRSLPDICNMVGSIVRIFEGKIIPFDLHSLMHFLGGEVQYYVKTKSDTDKDVNPPHDLIRQKLSVPDDIKGIKLLKSVITTPIVRLDGSLITQQGYDKKTGLYLDLDDEYQNVIESPTVEDVKEALSQLMKPFENFPFINAIDRSVLLAGLLSAIVRPILPKCPAIAFDAPVQGSGKTLLATCVGALSLGRTPSVHPHTSLKTKGADDEIRKLILSDLMSGERIMIWDNILGVFSSSALASILTSSIMPGRVLGASKTVHVENKMLFILTGNNLCFAGDMPRRVLTCGIDPKMPNPFSRSFKIEPLNYVLKHREKMVVASLTIIRGWFSSLEYKDKKTASGRMASFENWDDLVVNL